MMGHRETITIMTTPIGYIRAGERLMEQIREEERQAKREAERERD